MCPGMIEAPREDVIGARNFRAAIRGNQTKEKLLKALQADEHIQEYLQYISMCPSVELALTREEAMEEALSYGWIVNGESFEPSIRSGKHYNSIHAARKSCQHICDMEASFCIDPDDIFCNILCNSSRSAMAQECKRALIAVISDSMKFLNMASASTHPVEIDIFSHGVNIKEGSPIFCRTRFIYSFQLMHRDMSRRSKSCKTEEASSSKTVVLYKDDYDAEEVLTFDAVVSQHMSFVGSGLADSVRNMEIVVADCESRGERQHFKFTLM